MDTNIIYRLTYSLTEEGFEEYLGDFTCKKTKQGFILDRQSNFGGKTTRVKNSEILKLDSMVRENMYHLISYYTYYFHGQEQQAKDLLLKAISETANRQLYTASIMINHLKNKI